MGINIDTHIIYIRTIQEIEEHLQALEEVVHHRLIPAIIGGHIVNDNERDLIALPPRYGGLGIKIIKDVAKQEYENSKMMTLHLKNLILGRSEENVIIKAKSEIKQKRNEIHKSTLEKIRSNMSDQEKRINEANQEIGSYNWLTSLPIKENNYNLNKDQFWDALRIRFNWNILGYHQNVHMEKKGGFVSIRHNEVRDITTQLLKEVCSDVKKEPPLIGLTGELMSEQTAVLSKEAHLDISARGFWVPGQKVFCDIRVFGLNAQRYWNTDLKREMLQKKRRRKKGKV